MKSPKKRGREKKQSGLDKFPAEQFSAASVVAPPWGANETSWMHAARWVEIAASARTYTQKEKSVFFLTDDPPFR